MNITDEHNKSRPAIKVDPLPLPGESLRNEIDRLTNDRLGPWVSVFCICLLLCSLELYRYFRNVPVTAQSATAFTIVGVLGAGISLRQLFKIRKTFRMLYLGLRGEHHVGRYLDDECARIGYHVIHNIPANDFNVDHVLVGPGGIFAIETKNWTLPPKGTKATLRYDGTKLIKFDDTFDVHALTEARACADYIRKIVAEWTGRDPKGIPVRPVLIFPGWWIEGKSFHHEIWVFGNDTLHKILPRESCRLSDENISLFHQSLITYTRNFKK